MQNYDRYKTTTSQSFEKKGVMDYLVRICSDRILLPLIENIKGKRILDVGPGTGNYTKLLLKNNEVVGIDRNPHLCQLPIEILQGDATQLVELAGMENYDMVFSTWMTEYLNPEQLNVFFQQAKMALNKNGELISTIISKYGFGGLYINAAKMIRGIAKYNYSKKQVSDMLTAVGFINIEIINLNSWLGIPWAYLIKAK
jgi:SAM-dependent methyltransferase